MTTYRPKLVASLSLLLATSVIAVFTILFHAWPVAAAGNRPSQFVFGPITALTGRDVVFSYHNAGTRPTPGASISFRNAETGTLLHEGGLPSLQSGKGASDGFVASVPTLLVAVLTFNRPSAGQAIPSPLSGTVQILNSGIVDAALYPAH